MRLAGKAAVREQKPLQLSVLMLQACGPWAQRGLAAGQWKLEAWTQQQWKVAWIDQKLYISSRRLTRKSGSQLDLTVLEENNSHSLTCWMLPHC